jgi:8-oxo-dGTP pyrophosphatase MutT (NUDIX family)
MATILATDHLAASFPVSVKGVVLVEGKVLLLKNEREEWELPGGKLERGEAPETCCARELWEETNLSVKAVKLLDVWLYRVTPEVEVLIVTYGCTLIHPPEVRISHEHKEAGLFTADQLPVGNTPAGYIRSVREWFSRC